jgi:hypothetical protein
VEMVAAEAEHYQNSGGDFKTDESNYHRGFETALQAGTDQAMPGAAGDEAFQQVYARGIRYRESLRETYKG